MLTFLIGMAILVLGGMAYGAYVQKVFGPDDRKTPAITMEDGVDYVPMNKWKNSLVQLLNIAGTGPILGPIQGILFGPIAFLMIPIGCVLGGAMHDYLSGMISMREEGKQMPALIEKFLGKGIYNAYNIFICFLMLLVGAVFIYTPGDLAVTQVLGQKATPSNPVVWIVYGLIFVYYLIATLFPIDKIIGKIYPIFGAILLLSAVGVGVGIFVKGYPLTNIDFSHLNMHPKGTPILPIFFVTVACGIVSGFHSTQSTMIARSVQNEREGKMTFFNMMLLEGFIAMIWAAASMGVYQLNLVDKDLIGQASVIGIVSKNLLGSVGGMIAIIGVIVLPITSGDTALRSLRLMLGDALHIDQSNKRNRVMITTCIFVPVILILIFAKLNSEGFNVLWRYFAWSNQTIAIFAFAMITVYLYKEGKNFLISLLPGCFYAFIISTFLLNAKIGFGLSLNTSYILGAIFTVLYCGFTIYLSKNKKESLLINDKLSA